MRCDSQASLLARTLASPYFGRKLKARVTKVDVNIEDINNFFGPKLNKNGWKYNNHPNA
jgi:hypothetical protein